MRPDEIKKGVNELGLSEKLLLVEDIWDSIAADNSEIPMQAWQKNELDNRYKEYREVKLCLHDWEEVHKEIRKKYR